MRSDRGAALVEFGIIAPLLLTLMFGIFEFGLLFGTKLDVRNGAAEGARLIAVNYQATPSSTGSTQTTEIVTETCNRMGLAGNSKVSITFPGGTAVGDTATIKIEQPFQSITGFFDPLLANTTVESEVETRLEQEATMAAVAQEACP